MINDTPCPSISSLSSIISSIDYGNSKIDKSHFSDPENLKAYQKCIPETEIKASIKQIWENIYTSKSTFYSDFHKKRGEDAPIVPWELNSDKSVGFRYITYHVTPDGKDKTLLNESQRFIYYRDGDGGGVRLVFQISTYTPDLNFGNTFRCEILIDHRSPSEEAPKAIIAFYIKLSKVSNGFYAIKAMAARRALPELTKSYRVMLVMMQEIFGASPAEIASTEVAVHEVVIAEAEKSDLEGTLRLISVFLSLLTFFVTYSSNKTISGLQTSLLTYDKRWQTFNEAVSPYSHNIVTNKRDLSNVNELIIPDWADVLTEEIVRLNYNIFWLYSLIFALILAGLVYAVLSYRRTIYADY